MEIKQIKKIVITGPECTGKSDLSGFLATYFNTAKVNEYARHFIDKLKRPYLESDLTSIAKGQVDSEKKTLPQAKGLLIYDTDLITIKLWSYFNYGRCDKEILRLMSSQHYDLHLLTCIDIPWKEDSQREHPQQRKKLWKMFRKELENQNKPYVIIRGDRKKRRYTAIQAIKKIL